MPAALKPLNEKQRIEALRSYQILDTEPAQGFDDITMIASKIVNTPVAVVSLVDKDRQWFKSCLGLDATETPRDQAFCAHAILDDKPMIVENALTDPRVLDNPLVTGDLGIRFYVGIPLIDSAGLALGTLCVIDFKQGKVSERELEILKALSRQVVSQLELHRHLQAAETQIIELDTEGRIAKQASEAKSAFLANMSHELRTPMNSIIGFSRRLLKKIGDDISERDCDALETIHRNANHLLELINDILDISKIEAGKMELETEEFEFDSVLDGVAKCLSEKAESKGLFLKLEKREETVNLVADKTKLIQVVMNLVSNAIKFTEEGGVTLSFTVYEEEKSNWLRLTVEDTGIGISERDMKLLFSKFTQVHSEKQCKVGGTGLGLAITKELVEMHGGSIAVESVLGEGAKFIVQLPVQTKITEANETSGSSREEESHVR